VLEGDGDPQALKFSFKGVGSFSFQVAPLGMLTVPNSQVFLYHQDFKHLCSGVVLRWSVRLPVRIVRWLKQKPTKIVECLAMPNSQNIPTDLLAKPLDPSSINVMVDMDSGHKRLGSCSRVRPTLSEGWLQPLNSGGCGQRT
jgi:hypothetical protein